MPPADPRTRDEWYDDTRECNAPRAGRKAVCIFHAGAAPAVIENIYMLFMGHTCFRNQTRHRATPVDSPHVLSPRLTFARFRSFFSTSFPSTASLFLFRCSLRNGVFRRYSLSQLLHPLPRRKTPDLPATSREFYKTFHASLTTLPLPTHRRNNEYSYGLNFWWNRPLRALDPPSSTIPFSVTAFPRPRCSPSLVRWVRTASKHRDDFFLYRFLRACDITTNEIDEEKGAHLRKVERAGTRTFAYAKSEGSRLLFRVSDIRKEHNTIQRLAFPRGVEKKLVSFVVHFITANCNGDHSYCNIAESTYTTTYTR